MSKGKGGVWTKQVSEMFPDPKISAENWGPVLESSMYVQALQDIPSVMAGLHGTKVQVTNLASVS